jgi:hypothetical protein
MTRDEEHLRLLSIFHYVVAGIEFLCSCFPLLYVAFGLLLVFAPENLEESGERPPEAIGWIVVGFAGSMMAVWWVIAGCILAAGRSIAARKRYLFCLIIAGVECIFMPFGTVLGVFTIVVLTRESVKQLFDGEATSVAEEAIRPMS